ncbi:MAG: nucleotidyltransferase domain-containing protein [Persephonella sp.]|nr:MAG: nucleotidyltransferase domain-containing protein [Persephonella sp.]
MENRLNKVRLDLKSILIIKDTAKKVFGDNSKVYIFGSRADINRKGGDIDIFVETDKEISIKDEIEFLTILEKKGLTRKVDLVVKSPNKKDKNIHKEAREKGVLL